MCSNKYFKIIKTQWNWKEMTEQKNMSCGFDKLHTIIAVKSNTNFVTISVFRDGVFFLTHEKKCI